MQMIKKGELLTVHEAADMLGLTPIRVRQFCQEGRIGTKIGTTWIIERKELQEFKKIERPAGRPPHEK